jgi:hypothetical protein
MDCAYYCVEQTPDIVPIPLDFKLRKMIIALYEDKPVLLLRNNAIWSAWFDKEADTLRAECKETESGLVFVVEERIVDSMPKINE